jgi:hypothetical protein
MSNLVCIALCDLQFGLAVGCAAVALPRRKTASLISGCALMFLFADFTESKLRRGRSPLE